MTTGLLKLMIFPANIFMGLVLLVAATLALSSPGMSADIEVPALATADDVEAGAAILSRWIECYRAQDHTCQYNLTDPRIRGHYPPKAWKRFMKDARRRDGPLIEYSVRAVHPVDARDIPCTEMKHCYRQDVQVILVFLTSHYKKNDLVQEEYAAIARSSEGWRFGGGTILNRPMGETLLILDRKDERRARSRVEDQTN